MASLLTPRLTEHFGTTAPVLLTATTETTLVAFTPLVDTMVIVDAYVVVQNAATTLALASAWTDPVTGNTESQEMTKFEGGSQSLGPSGGDQQFMAQSGGAVTISATAGTANNISVHCVVTLKTI